MGFLQLVDVIKNIQMRQLIDFGQKMNNNLKNIKNKVI